MGEDLAGRLIAEAVAETEQRRARASSEEVDRAAARYQPLDFAAALRRDGFAVIAEVKQRTPSMGVLTNDYRPADLALQYERGGAAAISVLTHGAGFGGSLEHLDAVRKAVRLPILRKDFITDAYQVAEARAHGADAVLLIVSAMRPEQLKGLLGVAQEHGLAALVEVHNEYEVHIAIAAGASVIGVNHRDLRTFAVDLALTERLRALIPAHCLVVAESGIKTQADAKRMRDAGADAILVGELLMRGSDPAALIGELRRA
ncbi:MAG TPA: indole-3-glycerol phosphate synthase TrpC [Candidatus Dormibacteraeota bacterium]